MLRWMLAAVVAAAAAAGIIATDGAGTATAAPALKPSAGTMLTGDLLQPRGFVIGPDGMIYIAEAGSGGASKVTLDGMEVGYGNSGRISKIDPATGARTTVVDGLPSSGDATEAIGPADVAFVGNQLYFIQAHGGAAFGFPDDPTGVYHVMSNGTVELIADLGQFNIDNPVADVTDGTQKDIEPGGNPYGLTARNGALYVSDGNQNQVTRVSTTGSIDRIAELSGHPVSTGITFATASGPFYVAELGQFPFAPADGKVVTVTNSGVVTTVASGYSMITDVAFGPGGQLYALQFAKQTANPTPDGPPVDPFTGTVLKVNADGTMTPVATSFTFSTFMEFSGNKLYVTSNGIAALGPGELWVIDNITTVPPLASPTAAAPAPTATPRTGVTAPDTGYGPTDGGNSVTSWLALLAALAIAGASTSALAFVLRRR